MTDTPSSSDHRYAHLHANAAAQKQATVDRLRRAIDLLEAEGRPVNTFTIKEVSGLDYMAYYRNREAFTLFQQHSTHLRKEREQTHAKQSHQHSAKRKHAEDIHAVKVSPRDPLLDYKRPRLVQLVREAQAERDQIKQQAQEACTNLQQRYHALIQEHMQCGLKIARLEAELAEFQAFMERFRSSLKHEEQEL